MTVEELILIDSSKVRRDSNLMSLYIQHYKTAFGRVPDCAGCSFSSGWQKLVSKYSKNSVTLQIMKIMNTITIKRIEGKILSYNKAGKTFRLYDNILNDDFINEYVSNGTDEEISERKKLFTFPDEEKVQPFSKEMNEIFRPNTTSTLDTLGNNSQPKKRGRKARK